MLHLSIKNKQKEEKKIPELALSLRENYDGTISLCGCDGSRNWDILFMTQKGTVFLCTGLDRIAGLKTNAGTQIIVE